MTTSLVFLFLAWVLLFVWKCRRCAAVVFIFWIGLGLAIGTGLIPSRLVGWLQRDNVTALPPTFGRRVAVVLLGAGTVTPASRANLEPTLFGYPRIEKSAAIYHAAIASGAECVMIVSGGDTSHLGLSEAEVYGARLEQCGVPAAALRLEKRSLNTFQNAQFTKPILDEGHFDQVILVTSGLHLKRSIIYFNRFGLHPQPVAADYTPCAVGLIPLGYNFAIADLSWHEITGIIRLHLYDALGWNK